MSKVYAPGVKPGISLYNLWHTLLGLSCDFQDEFAKYKTGRTRAYAHGGWGFANNLSAKHPTVGYGANRCGIGVWDWDPQGRPILVYGKQYDRNYPLYGTLAINADGNFMLLNAHGVSRDRTERHTFLSWTWHQGVVWTVDTTHGYGKPYTGDWQKPVPYVSQRIIQSTWQYVQTPNNGYQPLLQPRWLTTEPHESGWEIKPASMVDSWVGEYERFVRLRDRRYGILQRNWYNSRGLRLPSTEPKLRDGKQTHVGTNAAMTIAALLDVSQPAKPRLLRKAASEATTQKVSA